jgi:hypothetical protein
VLEIEPTIGRFAPEPTAGSATCHPVALPLVVNSRSVIGTVPDVVPSPYCDTTILPGVNCAQATVEPMVAMTHHARPHQAREARRRAIMATFRA